jgi:hypothetical protein
MHRDQPIGGHRLGLALEREWRHRLHLDRVAGQPQRLLPDQDLAGLGSLLQPRRHVDRVPGRKTLLRACDHLAGRHADAARDAELGERVAHLHRRAHSPERVVLVDDRDSEDRHDGVADEFLHRAAVPLHHRLHTLEIPGEQPPERLRVELLSELCRTCHIAEEHRDDLALLTRGCCG